MAPHQAADTGAVRVKFVPRSAAEDLPPAARPKKLSIADVFPVAEDLPPAPAVLQKGTSEERSPKRFRSGGGDGLAEGNPVAIVNPVLHPTLLVLQMG